MNKNFIALEMAVELHQELLKVHVMNFQKDQMVRASLFVALNLSEGAARFTVNEKRRFYRIAFASLKETQTMIKIINTQDAKIIALSNKLGAAIYRLLLALDKPKL